MKEYTFCATIELTNKSFEIHFLKQERGAGIPMRSRIIGAVILLLFVLMAPLGLSNDYLRSRDFDTITVKPNENVWSIAARYVSDEKKAADLREAIIEINDLQKDGRMYAGQVIRVPVLPGETPSRSSEGDVNGFL